MFHEIFVIRQPVMNASFFACVGGDTPEQVAPAIRAAPAAEWGAARVSRTERPQGSRVRDRGR